MGYSSVSQGRGQSPFTPGLFPPLYPEYAWIFRKTASTFPEAGDLFE
jgi:hypothetical protein